MQWTPEDMFRGVEPWRIRQRGSELGLSVEREAEQMNHVAAELKNGKLAVICAENTISGSMTLYRINRRTSDET